MKLETNFIDHIKGRLNRLDINSRRDAYVFLICLGIAVLIWFLIVLSKQSATTLEYAIKFVDIPEDMILVNNPDSILVFRIESGGFELLTLKYLNSRKPVEINCRNLKLQKQNENYSASFPTAQISTNILKEHNFTEELVSISPQVIYFIFERLEGKMVPVVPDLNLSFEKQYRLKDSLILLPDSVKIIGSANHLQKINKLRTKSYSIEAVKSDGNIKCELDNPLAYNLANIMPAEVDIAYQVEKFTESSIMVSIEAADGNQAKFFPALAKVSFLVSLEDFSRVNEEMFKVVVDIPEDRSVNIVQIGVTSFPSFVEIIRVNPVKAEYLILKE